jgi:TRAP-type C4-dicarboxylate transport system substrate-binding protein
MWSRAVALAGVCLLLGTNMARSDVPLHLRVIGGLATAGQYEALEKPFWQHVGALSDGRVTAEIFPSDHSGLTASEILQLMRVGVVTFGTVLLLQVNQPELRAIDLPALSPDMEGLRRSVAAYRPHLEQILRSRFNVKLLAVYSYPAQEIFCTKELGGLSDLAGRKVRTSSFDQSVFVSALGAQPMILPYADIVTAVRSGLVDCAITGTMSGSEIHLVDATSFLYPLPINWGVSLFGVNVDAWESLPDDVQKALTGGIAKLEQEIWAAAERDTAAGIACDTGESACPDGQRPGHMKLTRVTRGDEARRRRLFIETVLPKWISLCGSVCVTAWNDTIAPVVGISASED